MMELSPSYLQKTLASLTENLLLPSETDASFQVVCFPEKPSKETLFSASGASEEATLEESSLAEFFFDLEREPTQPKEREISDAARFQQLHRFLQEELQEVKVWRIGQIDIEVWIWGREPDGTWIGLRSHLVET